jgi:hypothetical protein
LNEKWVQGPDDVAYFILPDGSFFLWDGSSQATGTLVANLDPSYWADPYLLLNATPGPAPALTPVTGTTLTIAPDSGFLGTFGVMVTASDGVRSDAKFFNVTVA